MVKLTVEQDMKLGSALDQLEDAIEAAHASASLKMVRWAQLNVARYVGGILGSELSASIRAESLMRQGRGTYVVAEADSLCGAKCRHGRMHEA